jgi:hypothetical protein
MPYDKALTGSHPGGEDEHRFGGADRFGNNPNPRVVLNTVDARQGVTGHNVRYVLGFGLLAIVIAFAALLYFEFFPYG